MKTRLWQYVLCLIVAMPAFAQSGNVEFKLSVTQDGQPLAGVDTNIDNRFSETTDANGALNLLMPAGTRRVALSRGGSALAQFSVSGSKGDVVESKVALSSTGGSPQISTKVIPAGADAAGTGTITGRIVASQAADNLTGAQIFIEGANLEAFADDTGAYTIQVPAGVYNVYAIHPEYSTQIVNDVRVIAGKQLDLNVDMSPTGVNQLADFLVLAPALEGTAAAALDTRRTLSGVSEVLSAEQISRAGDSDAASALKRVTGLSVVGGKFIFVRGLSERYSTSLFNGASLPSPDPARRVVPLDLFPTSILESVEVRKAYSADLPADFSAGAVIMRGKKTPVERLIEAGAGLSGNSDTTFQQGLSYRGGNTDYLGVDDGTRELPFPIAIIKDSVRNAQGQSPQIDQVADGVLLERLGELYPNNYTARREDFGPGNSFDLSLGDAFDLTETLRVGAIVSGSYNNDYSTVDREFNDINRTDVQNGGVTNDTDRFTAQQTERTVETSLFGNFGLEIGDNHVLTSTSMMLRNTTDTTEVRLGGNDSLEQFEETILEFVERQLLFQQFAGDHFFNIPGAPGSNIRWQLGAAQATLDRPDARDYFITINPRPGVDRELRNGPSFNVRQYTQQDDEIQLGSVDLEFPFAVSSGLLLTAKFGAAYDTRERDSDVFTFTFDIAQLVGDELNQNRTLEEILSPENIRPDGATLNEVTDIADSYTAEQDIDAVYGLFDFLLRDTVRLAVGARLESSDQRVISFGRPGSPSAGIRAVGGQNESNVLPSVNFTYSFSEDVQLRAGYSETINRPDVRELSQAIFVDPESRRITFGNPDLRQAELTNFDLRLEWFPGASEVFSAGLFFKEIDRPIERISLPIETGGLTFENANSADVYGLELEAIANLGRFFYGWQGFTLGGNVSLIDSTTTPATASLSGNTQERQLQGQSQYLANINLGYERDSGMQLNMLYNVFGERISEVGNNNAPNRLEQPFHALDLVFSMPFLRKYDFKFKIKNLLDQDKEVEQGGFLQERVSVGQDVSLSVQYKF